MEIKFFDRLKALESLKLYERERENDDAGAFYLALEKGAAAIKEDGERNG